MTQDEVEKAYERVKEANERLDDAWPRRHQGPEEMNDLQRAVAELNDAGMELIQALKRRESGD